MAASGRPGHRIAETREVADGPMMDFYAPGGVCRALGLPGDASSAVIEWLLLVIIFCHQSKLERTRGAGAPKAGQRVLQYVG